MNGLNNNQLPENLSANGTADSIAKFAVKRNITNLFKSFLVILETIEREHDEALTKLNNVLPAEHRNKIYLADHFTEDAAERIRKKILSEGNDCIRNIEGQLNMLDINFKK
jgi:hypothetical protein